MTITKTVNPEEIRIFGFVSDFLVDTIVDAPDFATTEDCVDFVYDNLCEEELSDADYAPIASKKGRALLVAYANFITNSVVS